MAPVNTSWQLPEDDGEGSIGPSVQQVSGRTISAAERAALDDVARKQHTDKLSLADSDQRLHVLCDEAAQSWLNAQCTMITGCSLGVVMGSTADSDDLKLLASWPNDTTEVPGYLIEAARSALHERSVVIVSPENNTGSDTDIRPSTCIVASPLKSGNSDGPVAVFELPDSILRQRQAIVQLLQWGGVWFDLLQRKQRSRLPTSRLTTVVELLASSLEHSDFNAASTTVVNELATHLGCTQVSLGLLQSRTVVVQAISNSARVDTRLNLTRDISAAMNEAVDQDATVAWPFQSAELPHVTFAQETLAKRRGNTSIISTPLYDGADAIGALTLERDGLDGFDQECKDVCETLAVLLGPVIALKHDKDQSIGWKVLDWIRNGVTQLCGPKHIAAKLYASILFVTLVFLSMATGDYRITAQARLEGSMTRVITAPRDGFVASATFRAGDVVKVGDVLARLDVRELRLEQLKLASEKEQLEKEHRAAMTSHDRSATAIVKTRIQQTSAQLELIGEHLLRTQLTAPFSGIVVSGDLSQSIGSPVENGQVLFEIAPLDDYRVILEVDERDIGEIAENQRGALTLTGLPDTTLDFSVDRIVPLSTAQDGRNVFEVHALLDAPIASMRPGMEGIGKIAVDQRKLIWVWSHELVDWWRLTLWTWIS